MATPVKFAGFNLPLRAPRGHEATIGPLSVYNNGSESISCWKLDPHELSEVQRTGEVWLSVQAGPSSPPVFVSGSALMEARDQDTNEPTVYYSDGRHVVEDAKFFARLHHGDQRYGNDLPFAYHLGKVVQVLRDFDFSWEMLSAGWLHDTEEDCWPEEPIAARRKRVLDRFGSTIEGLVWACTGQTVIDGVPQNRAARNAEQYKKIRHNPMAAFLKIADRTANMEECLREENSKFGSMYTGETDQFMSEIGWLGTQPMIDRLWRVHHSLVAAKVVHSDPKETQDHVPT